MLEQHRYLLIRFRDEIATDLLVDDVLIYLEANHVLDQDDKELIRHQPTSKRRAEKLLDILPTKGFEAFDVFYKILGSKYAHLAQLLKDGVSEEDFGEVLDFVDSPGQLTRMSTVHHDILTTNRVDIVEDLLVDDILNYLQSKFVIDSEDVELIKAENTSKRKTEKLLDIIVTKSDAAFYHFKDSLVETYPHLVKFLEENTIPRRESDAREVQEQVESILLEGGVPQRPDVFTNRAEDVHRVRIALHSLKEHDGWVILHGMAGCGKTVLAADALRSPQILNECFPGGVHWIRIGQIDQPKLLMKLQNLCTQLDSDHTRAPPRNLEEAKDRLRIIFAHQHPRSLLILDDLWSEYDIRYFDIRVRVLVTTRDSSITNVINGLKRKVKISEGYKTKESLEILSQWTGIPMNELPKGANEIVSSTRGSPLAISVIGALLRDHPNRWQYYLGQLQNKKYNKLKTNFAYQYPTLSDAFSISIDSLKEDLRKRYMDFAMFEDQAKVPAQVLCILWDEEFEEVEDTMDELVNKSLARKSVQSDDVNEIWYSIHNLQLTFLREKNSNPENLHKKLVEGYSNLYKGKFDEMEDDGYIHWNIVEHMGKAGMEGEAYNLLVDLSWVVAKLNITGPADLLNDYISVKKYKDSSIINGFYHFVSTNANLFVENILPDIVQLALQEPVTSKVYVQAKEQARKLSSKSKLYLDWCNKQENPLDSSLLITANVHNAAVYKCQFSKDAQKVVSCGTDNKVKVWDSQSGRELLSMNNHRDVVTCCSYSHDNSCIVSCSADQTVRIWDSSNGEEMLCFTGHSQDVFCCAFSPCDKAVVSCSADKTVKIWDSKSGSERLTFTGHTDIVRWCCFSLDGSKVASCSDDTTVKVFNSKDGQVLFSLENHISSVSFCSFMNAGKSVVAVSNNCVKVLDCNTGKEIKNFDASSNCLSLAFSPDESIVAMGFSDTTVQVWNTSTYASLGMYQGHTGWVHSVAFSSDATKLVSGSEDETVKIWTIDASAVQDVISLRRVFDAYFGDGDLLVAVTDISNKLLLYVGDEGALKGESEALSHAITSITFSPDGKDIAAGCEGGSVKMFNRSCKVMYTFSYHSKPVRWCAFSQDGQQLVSASDDYTAKVYTNRPYGFVFSLDGHSDKIRRCRFFNQDNKILTASLDGTLKVWEVQTGTCEYTCYHSNNNDYLVTCDVSHDCQKLVSVSVDGFAKIWDAASGMLIHSLGPHKDVVRSVSISRDDNYLCTGCDDGTLRIWDMNSGKELAHCPKQDGWIYDCHFSPDGQTVVSVSDNIRWWSTSGVLKQEFFIKGGFAKDIHFSEDFQTFVTVTDTSTLYILKQITSIQ